MFLVFIHSTMHFANNQHNAMTGKDNYAICVLHFGDLSPAWIYSSYFDLLWVSWIFWHFLYSEANIQKQCHIQILRFRDNVSVIRCKCYIVRLEINTCTLLNAFSRVDPFSTGGSMTTGFWPFSPFDFWFYSILISYFKGVVPSLLGYDTREL